MARRSVARRGAIPAVRRRSERSTGHIVRDFPRVPTLAALNAPYLAKWEEMWDVLVRGWNRRGRRRELLRVAIAHSLDLPTWESLVCRHGLREADAVDLLVRLVRGA
jgi:hypothetical protein